MESGIIRAQEPHSPLQRFSHLIYTDLRGHQCWIKIGKNLPIGSTKCSLQDPTLSGTKFGLKSILLLAQIHKKKVPKCGLLVQFFAENPANLVHFFYILHSPWHKNWRNHTLSGTHLMFKTLPLLAHCLKTLPSLALKLAKMVP